MRDEQRLYPHSRVAGELIAVVGVDFAGLGFNDADHVAKVVPAVERGVVEQYQLAVQPLRRRDHGLKVVRHQRVHLNVAQRLDCAADAQA